MRIVGWLCVLIGTLNLMNVFLGENGFLPMSVFAPVFWVTLIVGYFCFAKLKEKEIEKEKEKEKEVNKAALAYLLQQTAKVRPKTVQVAELHQHKTYWENYKSCNPTIASDIENLLNINFSELSEIDVKEKIASVERLAKNLKCEISQIKSTYLAEIEKYPVELIPQIIEMTSRDLVKEVSTFHVSQDNTMSAMMITWLKERHEQFGKPDAKNNTVSTESMGIDETAKKIVSSFNTGDTVMFKRETQYMLSLIRHEEDMFSVVKCPYLVAKSLYFMLTEDFLSVDEQTSCVKLTYFCLLNNYLKNSDKKPGDPGYEDLVSGCKLCFVLIFMQSQYLMYSIIAGQCLFVNPQTHIRNQMLLFGGIVREAKTAHCDFLLEDVIESYFSDCFEEAYCYLPTGGDLLALKESCAPVIEKIEMEVCSNLSDDLDSWILLMNKLCLFPSTDRVESQYRDYSL